ncbi:MAG: GxxExxY protein [Chitinophagales bacterium]
MDKELKYKDITEKIIGASFEVHKFLGNGFQEVIYQRALAYEMSQKGLEFAREIEQQIFYKDLQEPIGTRRADFVVEGKVLVELKALIQLEDVHLAQALNYLKAYRLEVGLLINFGSKSMTFKRLILSPKSAKS